MNGTNNHHPLPSLSCSRRKDTAVYHYRTVWQMKAAEAGVTAVTSLVDQYILSRAQHRLGVSLYCCCYLRRLLDLLRLIRLSCADLIPTWSNKKKQQLLSFITRPQLSVALATTLSQTVRSTPTWEQKTGLLHSSRQRHWRFTAG